MAAAVSRRPSTWCSTDKSEDEAKRPLKPHPIAKVVPATVAERARSSAEARVALHTRLLARREEIEQALIARMYGVSDPSDTADLQYIEGLADAVAAALDYALLTLERGDARDALTPPALLGHARLAARAGVPVDVVLRRYTAGYALLNDLLIEAADAEQLDAATLQPLVRGHGGVFDRLLADVTQEYERGLADRLQLSSKRVVEKVERLLAGELVDTSSLAYDFDAHHLGVIVVGSDLGETMRLLARALDRRLLLVFRDEETGWAWLGGRRPLDPTEAAIAMCNVVPHPAALVAGESAQGLPGWRLTHLQARAALSIARRRTRVFTRYADVAILASMLKDPLLATSLREIYLAPLSRGADGGVLCETLRAYFAADRNTSSAAAALGVSRQTVRSRLSAIEERLGHSLAARGVELEAALRLDTYQADN
jgi:hypothetical protein